MAARGLDERAAFADAMAVAGAALAAAIGLVLLIGSHDAAFAFHGLLFLARGRHCGHRHPEPLFRRQGPGRAARRVRGRTDQGRHHRSRHLGHCRLRGRRPARLAARASRAQPRPAVDELRPPAATAHLGRDLRLRRQRPARHLVLRRAAHLPRPPRRPLGAVVRGVGLPALHRGGRHRLPARHHPGQGVRRARVVRRPVADDRLGRLPAGLPRHAGAAQGAAHLCGELVLSRLHRHHRHAASRQQRDDPRQPDEPQELHRLLRRPGRA